VYRFLIVSLMLLAGLFLAGCQMSSENNPIGIQKVDVGTLGSNVNSVKLVAGQSIDAGLVTFDDVDTDGNGQTDALQVTYSTKDGWVLSEIHLFVGNSLTSLPTTKSGNPQIGLFPYKSGAISTTSIIVTIPFSELGFSCANTEDYFVAAHASVKKGGQSESAWGDGQRLVTRGNWAMYFTIFISCDTTPSNIEYTIEKAFAYNANYSNCFTEYSEFNENGNRWGWTNGPLANGNYTFDVYATAGQCDITKGTKVGNLIVNYTGSTATVTMNISGTNPATGMAYGLEEFHLYAGTEEFPRNNKNELTIAPGQFPYKASELNNIKTYTFTVNNLSGNIYLIAHAAVSGFPKN
jgi:hypothetical protein